MSPPAWWLRARAAMRLLAGEPAAPVPAGAGLPPHRDLWALCAWAAQVAPADTPPLGEADHARAEALRMHTAVRSLKLLAAARAAERLLADAGISCLRLKGLALLPAYPSGGVRPMEDADLLVEPGRLGEAKAALLAAGYRPHPLGVDGPSAAPVISPTGLSIDLHARLLNARIPLWRELGCEAPDTWWRRRDPEAGTLTPGAHLAFVAAHAGKHWLVRSRWLADLAVLLGQRADLDEAVALLCETGLAPLGRAPLWAAREVLGLPVSPGSLAPLGELRASEARLLTALQSGRLDLEGSRMSRFLPMVPSTCGRLRVVRDTLVPGPREARERFGATSYPAFLWGRLKRLVGAAA